MSITKEKKQELINQHSINSNDTGSVEVQCAIITERINNLTSHMKIHSKDFISQRGLLMLVGQRKALLRYIANNNHERYMSILQKLNLRK